MTGTQNELSGNLAQEIKTLRTYFYHTPISVGFGISTAAQAQKVAEIAEGVVIGSLIVNELNNAGLAAAKSLASKLSQAIHNRK